MGGPQLKSQAKFLATKLGLQNFKASNGWLSKFVERYGLSLHKVKGEKLSADVVAANNFKDEFRITVSVGGYSLEKIYSGDECGMWFLFIIISPFWLNFQPAFSLRLKLFLQSDFNCTRLVPVIILCYRIYKTRIVFEKKNIVKAETVFRCFVCVNKPGKFFYRVSIKCGAILLFLFTLRLQYYRWPSKDEPKKIAKNMSCRKCWILKLAKKPFGNQSSK